MLGVARRNVQRLIKMPPLALPPLLIPLFFFAAFVGALGGIGDTKDFGYYSYMAFEFVFVLYMLTAFVGVFTAFDLAADYEMGIGNRLMLGAPRRMAIVAGYLMPSVGRAFLFSGIVWLIAIVTGLEVKGNALDIAGLMALALLLNLVAMLFGAGVALRIKSTQASPLILLPVFVVLFLAPVYTVRDKLSGWLHTAANINPLTPILEAGRGFLAGDPFHTGLAFACAAGLVLAMLLFAVTGMRRAEKTL
jgi:ABC-2 type transport system permease protein